MSVSKIKISDDITTDDSTIAASTKAVKVTYDKAVSVTPKSGTGISVSAETDGTMVSLTPVFSSQTTDIEVGNDGNQTPNYGETFKVPYFQYDKYGRVVSASTYTVKIPINNSSYCTYCSYCNCESSYCDCKHCSYCSYCSYCNCESLYCADCGVCNDKN